MKYSGFVLCIYHGAAKGEPLDERASKNLQEAQEHRRHREALASRCSNSQCSDCSYICQCKHRDEPTAKNSYDCYYEQERARMQAARRA